VKVLLISDVHSNFEALKSVIEDANKRGGFDIIWNMGDIVGYGPDPSLCLSYLRGFRHECVIGNHDLGSLGEVSLDDFNPYAREACVWNGKNLDDEGREYLRGLPMRLVIGDFTIVHGSPRDPVWEYVLSVETALENFSYFDTKYCLIGHSHIPLIFGEGWFKKPSHGDVVSLRGRMIINPGGVGQPRDGDPRASYAVLDTGKNEVYFYRVDYDIEEVQRKMLRAGLPPFLAYRLKFGF